MRYELGRGLGREFRRDSWDTLTPLDVPSHKFRLPTSDPLRAPSQRGPAPGRRDQWNSCTPRNGGFSRYLLGVHRASYEHSPDGLVAYWLYLQCSCIVSKRDFSSVRCLREFHELLPGGLVA